MKNSWQILSLALPVMTLLSIQNASLGWSQDTPLIPREVLFGNPEKTSPQISPDGKRLTYIAPHEGVLNVWLRTIGQEDDRVITQDKKRGIRTQFWAEDSQHMLYLQDTDGDENWHIYSVNIGTNTIRDLTPFMGVQAQMIDTDPNHPNEVLVGLNVRDKRLHDVYRVNLKNGAVEEDTQNPGDVVSWLVDPDFEVRGASAMLPDGGTVLRIRKDTQSNWEEFVKWSAEDNFSGPVGFTPDGKGVYLQDSRKADTLRLVEKAIEGGEEKVISEDKQYDLGNVIIHPITHKLQAVSFVRAREEWTVLDESIAKDVENIKKIHHGDFSLLDRDHADNTWLVAFDNDQGPIPFYSYDRSTGKSTFLFTNRPKLEEYKLAPMKPISFPSRDGFTVHGYLTTPVDVEPKNLPMVLNVHGGPWGRDTWGYHPEAQWLANRGYVCLQVNFRGSTGYGKPFLNAGNREWGAKMQNDLTDAVEWAVKEGIADPKKVAIYGGSYGGYAALAGAAFTPDLYTCAIDVVGPSNIITLIQSIPPYWEPLRKMFDERVGNIDNEEEFLKSRSPLFKADQIKIPMLIAQGANDPRVKQAESEQIVNTLREKGKEVEYMLFPDEGHGFARPENRLKFYAAMEQFLGRHLGGRVEEAKEETKEAPEKAAEAKAGE